MEDSNHAREPPEDHQDEAGSDKDSSASQEHNAPMVPSDEDLVREAKKGDRNAGQILVLRYSGLLFVLGLHRLKGNKRARQLAEEAAQNTWLHAFSHLANLRDGKAFWPWLSTIHRRCCVDQVRPKQATQMMPIDQASSLLLSRESDPEETAVGRDFVEFLELLLARLPQNHRRAFTLRHLEGLSIKEAAAVMNAPANSVQGWCARALAQLREELACEVEQHSCLPDSCPRAEQNRPEEGASPTRRLDP